MKIVCATNMPYVLEAFGTLGEARVIEGRAIAAADVRDAELLALRSTTMVNRQLLEGSAVRFVGTATIGTDHMDIPWLEGHGIRWCYAPGCNANSVSEYVTTALLCLAARHGFTLAGKTIGVIGVGNVGSRVVTKAEALGLRVLQNDPPRERSEARGQKSEDRGQRSAFIGLDQLLREADIVTLHVPLTKAGPDKTLHLADETFFAAMKPGAIFFNCARGPVVHTDALLAAMERGVVAHAVIDTWEGEPGYRTDLMARADLVSPHIAGHSFEGRAMGTVMVYEAACRFLGVAPRWRIEGRWPPPVVPEVAVPAAGRSDEAALWDIAQRVYDIEADDRRFRESSQADDATRARRFDQLRKDYPMRREFRFTRGAAHGARPELMRTIAALGFATEGKEENAR